MKSKKQIKPKRKSRKSRKGGYLGDRPLIPWHTSHLNEIAISFLHGCSNGEVIKVPTNINIITLTHVGVDVPLHMSLDTEIRTFIESGNNFFNYNKKKLTREGNDFNTFLKSKDSSFEIRNHIEGQKMNDMFLSFEPEMTEYIGTEIYVESPRQKVRSFFNTYKVNNKTIPLPQMTIYDLVRYICGVDDISQVETGEGRLTLILVACRDTCGKAPTEIRKLMRQVSDKGDLYTGTILNTS